MRLTYDILADKRDGKVLSADDITQFLNGILDGTINDYQASALLMAVCIRGLNAAELSVWADRMLHSGTIMDFSESTAFKVDKHSTGGVGDKISIPLAPALAVLGLQVPMISGRGLGHTGGTLDKLEAIPGFNVRLDLPTFKKQVLTVGCSLIGQTPEIAPLDKKLYALRDVTGTVESIPLIASSIMSKKLAEGINGLILDVKVGAGAFMKDLESAKKLAQTMKTIGESFGTKVTVLFTSMDEPLGFAIGNALEIKESIEVLNGKKIPEVTELTELQGAALLSLMGIEKEIEKGRMMVRKTLTNGTALAKFMEIVKYQGGDTEAILNPEKLPKAKHILEIKAEKSGFVHKTDALSFGKALVMLGGGRVKQEDLVDPSVGFVLNKKYGEKVSAGELLYTVHYNDQDKLDKAGYYLKDAFEIGDSQGMPEHLILGTL